MRHAAITLILLAALAGCSGPETDARMQRHYENRKEHFHNLVMAPHCQIKKSKILWRNEDTEDNALCRELLTKIEADGVAIDPGSGGIMIIPSQRGYSSHQKGYIFSPKALAPLYPSLDEHPPDLQPYQMGFKRIDENWYITYEYVN